MSHGRPALPSVAVYRPCSGIGPVGPSSHCAAMESPVCVKTWVDRYAAEDSDSLRDRS